MGCIECYRFRRPAIALLRSLENFLSESFYKYSTPPAPRKKRPDNEFCSVRVHSPDSRKRGDVTVFFQSYRWPETKARLSPRQVMRFPVQTGLRIFSNFLL